MKEYFFKIRKTNFKPRKFGERFCFFNTYISIDNNKLKIKSSRENGIYNRKYNSNSEGEFEVNIDDISSIKYKIGYAFSYYHFFYILVMIFLIIGLCIRFTNIVLMCNENISSNFLLTNLISSFTFYFPTLICILFIFTNLTTKCIQINVANDDIIRSNKPKKIIFPISSIFFQNVPKKDSQMLNLFIQDIKKYNENIIYKKDQLKKIFLSIITIIVCVGIFIPSLIRYNFLLENDFNFNEKNNLLNIDVSFDKAILLAIQKPNDYNISKKRYIYVFKSVTTGEIFEINNLYNMTTSEIYNIAIIKYYKKNTNKLFYIEYKIDEYNKSNVLTVCKHNKYYYHDYISNKTYIFNTLTNQKIPEYSTNLYYKKTTENNTLYNFINSNIDEIRIDENLDYHFVNLKYNSIKKIDCFDSTYGKCYILKLVCENTVNYAMYIKNDVNSSEKKHDAIILESFNRKSDFFSNDISASNSFKKIVQSN